jgi:hypothetical protein
LNRLEARLRLLEVFPDELAIGAKHHLHILMPQLLGDIPRVVSGGQQGRCIGVADLIRIAVKGYQTAS